GSIDSWFQPTGRSSIPTVLGGHRWPSRTTASLFERLCPPGCPRVPSLRPTPRGPGGPALLHSIPTILVRKHGVGSGFSSLGVELQLPGQGSRRPPPDVTTGEPHGHASSVRGQ